MTRARFIAIPFVVLGLGPACDKAPPPATPTDLLAGEAEAAAGDGATKETTAEAQVDGQAETGPPPTDEDLDMTEADFVCILDWPKVGAYRITNLLGHQEEALAVANNVTGGTFPVGTVIQLVDFEAMVKRKQGWSTLTRDWEFFALKTSQLGTTIVTRGTTEVKNQFGGNCFGCHSVAGAKWDFTCGGEHGCEPLPFSDERVQDIQAADPRCGK
jgi:hypothetical protein